MLVLGYPTEEPSYRKERLSGLGVVHYGKYHQAVADELEVLVQQFDDPDTHLGLNNSWMQEGFGHYLDWFYSVWSTRGGKKDGKSQMFEILESDSFDSLSELMLFVNHSSLIGSDPDDASANFENASAEILKRLFRSS